MNRLRQMVLATAVFLMFAVGCGPSSEEISGTVESQVAESVKATTESQPTLTPASTYTPFPSSTPQATYTPYPTFTPQPTSTPQATYTPYPTITSTPTPEDTATAVPTNTPMPQTVIQPTAVPPVAAPATDNLSTIKTEITDMLADIDQYRYSINIRNKNCNIYCKSFYNPVVCSDNIAIRERIISTISLDVSQDSQIVQNAYATYLNAANYIAELTANWTQVCQEAIANGETTKIMGELERSMITSGLNAPQGWLNAVNNELMSSGD